MPCRRNYSFWNTVDRYKTHISIGAGCLMLGVLLGSCRGPASQEPEKPYPAVSHVYQIDGVNNGWPVQRTEMSDNRDEISFANDAQAKVYTNVRDLEKQDVKSKREYWGDVRRNITSKMREADVMKSK